jgi:hypothetical protein
MTLQEKQSLIKESKEAAIAALNAYLDAVYNLTDDYFDEEGNLLDYLSEDEKLENFVKSLRSNTKDYENVRAKLINNDFNLSLFEINIVMLSFYYIDNRWKSQIEQLKIARNEAQKLIHLLIDNEELKI